MASETMFECATARSPRIEERRGSLPVRASVDLPFRRNRCRARRSPGTSCASSTNRGVFLGQAHYSAASQIALRMLGRSADPIDLSARIAAAQRFREQVVTDSTAYRLVHAEADFLPALIVDRYADCFALQALDQAMDRATPEIVAALEAQFSPRAIAARNDSGVLRSLEALPPRDRNFSPAHWTAPFPSAWNGFVMESRFGCADRRLACYP